MMCTLGNSREACIILEDGLLSETFPLGRGRPQGDSPSPRQYNICEQVFLLKVEFDPNISRLNLFSGVGRPVPEHVASARIDEEILIGSGTEKTESFADDANILTEQKYECVCRIKAIMEDFYRISGLKCNIDKTTIMFIGPDAMEEQRKIMELGFKICSSIKCLGFDICREGGLLTENFDRAIINIQRLVIH
jgi:Reverse transcriptase (RNA-dependent DNA polymerase)